MFYKGFDIETLTTAYYDRYGSQYADIGDSLFEEVPSAEEAMARVRDERNRRLSASDWTQLGDVPLTAPQKARWATYRQALRDITENFVWNETKWPVY